jgi:DNA-binding NtrC family response regulator
MIRVGATATESAQTVLKTPPILDLLAASHSAFPGAPLLIRGERGVGKDVLARLIHAASPRQGYSFIKVNCAAQGFERCEADLFGREKGVSPLACRRLLGSFEVANRGTVYLDEIGALPRALVPRLLHTLETGGVSRAGGREIMQVDVRVIASTVHGGGSSDCLWQELKRLNVVELCVPPLRQRPEEIPVWASFFLERFNCRYRRHVQLCPETIARFKSHTWPGNIRELEEAVHRLVVGGAGGPLD